MKKLGFFLLIVSTVIFVLAGFAFFITRGEPKATVDYLAEYNRISQPANYDPCQNAALLYKKAFDAFVKMPKLLEIHNAEWTDDFDKSEQDLLQKWLAANENCFQKFKFASQKPYYWLERRAFDNDLANIQMPESGNLNYMCEAILWNAKLNATHGKYAEAFDDLLACYRATYQQCNRTCFIVELQTNMWTQEKVVRTTSLILKKTQVPTFVLKSFQNKMEEILDKYGYSFDFREDKLMLYDILQRIYIYRPDGSGRLSWKGIKDLSGYDLRCCGKSGWWLFKNIFAGPNQNEVKNQIDLYYKEVMTTFTMSPWELHQKKLENFEKLERLQFDNLFLIAHGIWYGGYYNKYYYLKTRFESLITTVAILRFSQDKRHLPDDLDELIKTEYLRQFPIDPYSGKSLIYKVEDDNFKIYSIGQNFKDDGGKGTGDLIFWPVWERPKTDDSNSPITEPNNLPL